LETAEKKVQDTSCWSLVVSDSLKESPKIGDLVYDTQVYETAEKEVQEISCRGSGGVPQDYKGPPRLGD
jgi:hypothetical protein